MALLALVATLALPTSDLVDYSLLTTVEEPRSNVTDPWTHATVISCPR